MPVHAIIAEALVTTTHVGVGMPLTLIWQGLACQCGLHTRALPASLQAQLGGWPAARTIRCPQTREAIAHVGSKLVRARHHGTYGLWEAFTRDLNAPRSPQKGVVNKGMKVFNDFSLIHSQWFSFTVHPFS
jgi:hypothetical protein